jgi:hypothetical protein
MSQAVLNELLDIGLRYAPEYRGGLSNHLPMALGALHALGADEDRLREFFDRYAPRLRLGAGGGRALADWSASLGRIDAFADLSVTFRTMLEDEGAAPVLRRVLPRLMPGVGAAAFHGLIRTAYGVAAAHAGETAAGLAYWACRHLPLDAPAVPGVDQRDPATWVRAFAADLAGISVEGGLIFERMRVVAGTEAFARHAGRLIIDARTLSTLADFAAQRYVATRNFTVLHLVTSCHAMRVLLPWLADPDAALQAYARAYAAGCIASGIDLQSSLLPPTSAAPGWPQVVQHALASNDDHVIKLVHSCREDAQAYGDGARLQAAALAVGG